MLRGGGRCFVDLRELHTCCMFKGTLTYIDNDRVGLTHISTIGPKALRAQFDRSNKYLFVITNNLLWLLAQKLVHW